jgi:hypothetical protein
LPFIWAAGCAAEGALRLRNVPSELESFFVSPQKNGIFDKRSALQVKRASSAALLFII